MPVTVTNTENVKSMNASRQLSTKKNELSIRVYIHKQFSSQIKRKLSKSVSTKDKSTKR